MNPHRSPRLHPFMALALLAIGLAASGCFNPFSPRIAPVLGFSKPAPVPNNASNLLRLFEWCYNNKANTEYRELFTDDYRFVFDPVDSSGAEYQGTPWTREDELISAAHLFVGGSADQEPASSITMRLDRSFNVIPDGNYVKWDPTGVWHKSVRTQLFLTIQTPNGSGWDISGAATFFLVRGDSALIPQELKDLGFGPDPNRWYIRRLLDETAHPDAGGGLASVGPATGQVRATAPVAAPAAVAELPIEVSWGFIRAYYRGRPGSASPAVAGRLPAR